MVNINTYLYTVNRIVSNPSSYPGIHLIPSPRTSFKPLEPKSQLLIIWKAFFEYLNEKISNYKGVNAKNFGTFTYEVSFLYLN